MLDRRGIVLQLVNVIAETPILRLQLLHLLLQLASLFALMREYSKTVVPEDDAVTHHERERSGPQCCELPPRIVKPRTHCGDSRNHAKSLRILLLSAQNTLTRNEPA